ncbi:mpv17-like protein [Penaeus chinensis]|uniref:mpv17-like protein n=1 Tax=Penaeus chinensis TaxID=139456 RepID=UPI001FB6F9B7|nr:mpv17-like protein [Penaeus chinensis]
MTLGNLNLAFTHSACVIAGLEQVLFAPVGQTQFYLGITLLEGRPWPECLKEWREKLIPTWKVAVCFWPVVQTVNFAYVPEKNRVVVVSVASFVWTIFLSYMHHFDQEMLPLFLKRIDQSRETLSNGKCSQSDKE